MNNPSHEAKKEKADMIVNEFKQLIESIYFIKNRDTMISMIVHAKHLYLNTFDPFDYKNRERIKRMYKNFIRKK